MPAPPAVRSSRGSLPDDAVATTGAGGCSYSCSAAARAGALKRGRGAVNFRLIAEQWDRIGQFYAAFPAGHAPVQRLNRFQASNRF